MPSTPLAECPEELLIPIDEIPGPWAVIHSRSKCEKLIAHHLAILGVPYFLPLLETTSKSRNRALIPLFSGILFIAAPPFNPTHEGLEHSKKIAIRSHRVFSFLHTRSEASQATLKKELFLLSLESPQRRTLQPTNHQFSTSVKAGTPVEITAPHAAAGLRGTIDLTTKPNRFHILLTFLGRVCSMEIDPIFLRPIGTNGSEAA